MGLRLQVFTSSPSCVLNFWWKIGNRCWSSSFKIEGIDNLCILQKDRTTNAPSSVPMLLHIDSSTMKFSFIRLPSVQRLFYDHPLKLASGSKPKAHDAHHFEAYGLPTYTHGNLGNFTCQSTCDSHGVNWISIVMVSLWIIPFRNHMMQEARHDPRGA